MNSTAPNLDPLTKYTELRRSLEDLQREFSEFAEHRPFFHHQMIFAPKQPLSDAAWESFAVAYETTFLEGLWEEWDTSSGGVWCGHWYGTRGWFERFQSLSGRGLATLKRMKDTIDGHSGLPEGVLVLLPEQDDHNGWLDWIYKTAEYAVEPLHIQGHRWNLDDRTDSDEAEDLMYNSWSPGDTPGVEYPDHPFYLTVGQDLFSASAAMISTWLDPERYPDCGVRLSPSPPVVLPVVGATPLGAVIGGPSVADRRCEISEDACQRDLAPRYDEDTRELHLGEGLQKCFRQPASVKDGKPFNQETLVMAFHLADWRRRIENPFKDLPSGLPRERVLIQTIFDFNEYVRRKGGLLRFRTIHNCAEWYTMSSPRNKAE